MARRQSSERVVRRIRASAARDAASFSSSFSEKVVMEVR